MSRDIKLKGTLPKNDLNGLKEIVELVLREPMKRRVAIVVFDAPNTEIDNEKGVNSPKVRVCAIEPITDDAKSTQVQLVMNDLYSERTGKKELELDYTDDEADE